VPGTTYSVRTASGATPVATTAATTQWGVFRAYTSLDNATQGLENPGLGAAWRDFDSAVNGKDLVAADETWNFACYADGVDTTSAALCNADTTPALEGCAAGGNHGWRTDATHTVRIYTPVAPTEVGVSQRHTGRWGTGYRRTAALYLYPGFLWADGLSQMVGVNLRNYAIPATGVGGRVWLSNSFGWDTCPSCANMRVFDTWSGGVVGARQAEVYLWNDIGVAESTGDVNAGVFYLNTGQARYWLFNCTAVARGAGYAFCPGTTADLYTGKNLLGVAGTGQAFKSATRWASLSTSAGTDSSVFTASQGAVVDNSATVFSNQVFTFVNAAGTDYHLALGDVGARQRGADLSMEQVLAFTDDVDGDFRPPGANRWDLGADQVPVVVDAGVDAGVSDAGVDGGGVPDDGGTDGGVADGGGMDGGAADAGLDAGVADDAGLPDGGPGDAGVDPGNAHYLVGCGCDGTGGASLAVLALVLASRRRRAGRV
jgi:uncharacterized protein (TIGR03382 family)